VRIVRTTRVRAQFRARGVEGCVGLRRERRAVIRTTGQNLFRSL
jgi:hypothetical protein